MLLFLLVLRLRLLSLIDAAALRGDKLRPEDFQEEDYQDRNFVSPPSDIQYYNRNLELELDLSPLSFEEWQLLGLLERIQVTIEREVGSKSLTKLSSVRPKLLEFLDKLKSLPELDHGLNLYGLEHFLNNNGLDQHMEIQEIEGIHHHRDGFQNKTDFLQYVTKEPRRKRSIEKDDLYPEDTEEVHLELETELEEIQLEDSHKPGEEEEIELASHSEDNKEHVFDEGRYGAEMQEHKSSWRDTTVTDESNNLWMKFLKSAARHRNSIKDKLEEIS